MLDTVSSADFAPYLHQPFRIRLAQGQEVEVELISVTDYEGERGAGNSERRQPFSLIFRGAPALYLPQQIYDIEHDVLGSLSLFLVRIGPDAVGMRFEAVFG